MELDFQYNCGFNEIICFPEFVWSDLPRAAEDIKETVFVTGQASPTVLAAGGTADQQE